MKNSPAKNKIKMYFFLALLFVSIGFGLYGYFQFKKYSKLVGSASENQVKAFEYEQLMLKINSEIDSCKTIISQGEGEFAKFEYCKGFVEFFDTSAPVLE